MKDDTSNWKPKKELKMTRICPHCGDQYGLWRERCPSCGTHNERRAAAVADERVPSITRPARVKKERKAKPDPCIMCHRRVKGKRIKGTKLRESPPRCPHCDEPIHKECLRLHATSCAEFQVSRDEAIKKLEGATA